MQFLLDQSAEARIAAFLATQGYDIKRIGSEYPAGLPDTKVLEIARSETRILITNDKDFGELIFRQKLPHSSVILLRFPLNSTAQQKIVSLKNLLISHKSHLRKFLVATPHGVRVRKTPAL